MLFQSFEFLLFLLLFIVAITVSPKNSILSITTISSLLFYYFWYPPYVILILLMILIAWLFSKILYKYERILPYAIIVAISPLIFFKYTAFILENIGLLLKLPQLKFEMALPLGISFITFTVISLLVDTVRKKKSPPSFFEISTYITFFPHLIAGPILRASSTIPQFKFIRVDWQVFPAALSLFAIGILKKVMFADPIGAYVDTAYNNISNLDFYGALTAIIGFSLQVYCDFSAYTDMAIALAIMFGVKFPENFKSPFLQTSITATWSCWHITLTHWFRDYLLIPIYSRTRHLSRHFAIIATMLASGLWHGASWTFVLWGLCHGIIIFLESITGYSEYASRKTGVIRFVLISTNFIIWSLICVLFRAENVNTAYAMWSALLRTPENLGSSNIHVLALCCFVMLIHKYDQAFFILSKSKKINSKISVPIAIAVIVGGILIFQGRPQNFYYFDF